VGYIDWATGPDFSLSIVYLAPVALVAWSAGRAPGLWLAVVAATTKFAADRMGAAPSSADIIVVSWNTSVELAALVIAVFLLSAVKEASAQLERKVEQRTAALREEVVERRRAEGAVRELASRLSEAEEAERRRLAADLHDSVGQALSVLKLNLEMADRAGDAERGPLPRGPDLRHLIDDIIRQVRTLTFSLHPAMLEDLGLVPTLRGYGEQFSAQTKTRVVVTERGEAQLLPISLAGYLFRAIKELLNNAAKHGRAHEVVVAVHWRTKGLRVVVDDDGTGFDPVELSIPQTCRGLGLAGIRQRLAALGGQVAINSEPDKGTRVILDVALERQAENGMLPV
jgi:signal transduction histidine kinase